MELQIKCRWKTGNAKFGCTIFVKPDVTDMDEMTRNMMRAYTSMLFVQCRSVCVCVCVCVCMHVGACVCVCSVCVLFLNISV